MQVKPTPPLAFQPPGSTSPPTRAYLLRSAANHAAMQQHTESVVQTAHGSHDRHTKAKLVRRKSAAVSSHSTELHNVHEDSASDLGMSIASDISAEDASALGKVHDAANVHSHCDGVQSLAHNADMPALSKEVSVQAPVAMSSVCCCVPDRLVAIHVRSELTESHFDM